MTRYEQNKAEYAQDRPGMMEAFFDMQSNNRPPHAPKTTAVSHFLLLWEVVALLLTRWLLTRWLVAPEHVPIGNLGLFMIGKAAPMIREEFIRHADRHLQVRPPEQVTCMPTRDLCRLQCRDNRHRQDWSGV